MIEKFCILAASCFACSSVYAEVLISEVMAKNSTGVVTQRGGKELDWIELANTGDEDVDVSGWYLSGNRGKAKKKWNMIEGRAVVPAGGFLVVWADKEYDQFASDEAYVRLGISTSGEELFLASPETESISDEMVFSFGQQIKDISFGRVADGSCAYFKEPTPGGANVTAGYDPSGMRQRIASWRRCSWSKGVPTQLHLRRRTSWSRRSSPMRTVGA